MANNMIDENTTVSCEKRFWKNRPHFAWGGRADWPYCWFAWWLITWGTELDGKWRINVSYLPD